MIDYGYNQVEISGGSKIVNDADLQNILIGIKSIGAGRVRILLAWDIIETSRGVYSWANVDRAVNACVANGLIPHFVISVAANLIGLANMPSFHSPATYGEFCGAIATRYGPAGMNVSQSYEIWNEPNNVAFFPYAKHPETYVTYLQAAFVAIKASHPSSIVVCGGSQAVGTGWPTVSPIDWYTAIYAAGGNAFFDALGFHWYSENLAFVFSAPTSAGDLIWPMLAQVRALMVAKGDTAKQVWLTELGVKSPPETNIIAQQWMQAYITNIATLNYLGPFFIYNYRNTGTTVGKGNNNCFGIVDFMLNPKQPLYSYCQTIATSDGTPTQPPPPGKPPNSQPAPPITLTASSIGSTTVNLTWAVEQLQPLPTKTNQSFGGRRGHFSSSGASQQSFLTPAPVSFNIYDAGVKIANVSDTNYTVTQLLPGTPQNFYVTAIDIYGHESLPSNTVTFTTAAPPGAQQFFQYNFTGTGSTTPVTFVQLGVGFNVSGGVALHNHSSVDGTFYLVAPNTADQASTDHFSEITLAAAAPTYGEVSAIALTRLNAAGTQWVGAFSYWGGVDSCRIVTFYNNIITIQNAVSTRALVIGEKLRCTAQGNIYTATMTDVNGVMTDLVSWTDLSNIFPGATNRRTGLGWQFIRSSSVNYDAPGISGLWKGFDVGPVVTQPGVSDCWELGVTHSRDWPEVITTGLWQAEV